MIIKIGGNKMTGADIKEFMETVGENADIMLFGDNAINFFNGHRNGHIFLDGDTIHYFANTGNTIPDTYYKEDGDKYTKSCEYTRCDAEMIQFARAKLDPVQVKEVTDKLVAKGFITADNQKEVLKDIVVMGRRGKHRKTTQEITHV